MTGPTPYYQDGTVTLHHGEALTVLRALPDGAVNCCVTSPPYFGLRDYDVEPTDWPGVEFEPMPGLPPVTVPPMRCCLGLEPDPWAYVGHLVLIFEQVRRVLTADGTLWLNLGDSYAGKANGGASVDQHGGTGHRTGIMPRRINTTAAAPYKSMLGIPWRVAFALQAAGWAQRNDVVWNKPNAMPEPVTDRLSNRYEHLFMFSKSTRYWFDLDPIREQLIHPDAADGTTVFGGRNKAGALRTGSSARRTGSTYGRTWAERQAAGAPKRHGLDGAAAAGDSDFSTNEKGRNPGDVWTISTVPFPEAHFAVMAPAVANRCVVAGCRPGGTVLDPFSGAGTTGQAAGKTSRNYIGIDASRAYLDLSLRTRLAQYALMDVE